MSYLQINKMSRLFKIKALIKINKDGRRTWPILTGYRPGFKFGDKMQTSGCILLLNGKDLKPGEEGVVDIKFVSNELLGEIGIGTKFRFYEGPYEIKHGEVRELMGWVESY